jgi:hypothetical protein
MNINVEGLSDETRAKAEKAAELSRENIKTLLRLTQIGAEANTTDAQFTFFFRKLIDFGILTKDQFWDMRLDWETSLKRDLTEYEKKVKEAMAAQQAEVEKQMNRQRLLQGISVPQVFDKRHKK